jgi:hypothetical protein
MHDTCILWMRCVRLWCSEVQRYKGVPMCYCIIVSIVFGSRPWFSNISTETPSDCLLFNIVVEDVPECAVTLGGDVDCTTLGNTLRFFGDESGFTVSVGVNEVIRPNCVDSSTSALRIGSPALRDGYRFDGGCVSKWTMSPAACLRKSSRLVSGTGTTCGMNSTVSHTLSLRCLGN